VGPRIKSVYVKLHWRTNILGTWSFRSSSMSDSESVKLHYKVFRHSVVPSITSSSVSESIKLHSFYIFLPVFSESVVIHNKTFRHSKFQYVR